MMQGGRERSTDARRPTPAPSYIAYYKPAHFSSILAFIVNSTARKAFKMCSFHQPDCSVVIDAFQTPCANTYDIFMQDQEFGSLATELEASFPVLREVLGKKYPLVRCVTLAFLCRCTNTVPDAEGQIPS